MTMPRDPLLDPEERELAAQLARIAPVSYTHRDVYKRQGLPDAAADQYRDIRTAG